MLEVGELLKELIKIPSPSGEEPLICTYVSEILRREQFTIIHNPVDNNGFNIVAKIGKPKIALLAHLDTVSPYIEYKKVNTKIMGRGACDTKGSVASMICAAVRAKANGISNFELIFTVGEEKDFRGIRAFTSSNEPTSFVIVGEPTGLKVVNGHFGYLELTVKSTGKAAHTSNPALGENAIEKLIDATDLIRKNVQVNSETTMCLTNISGGTAANVVPEFAEALYSFRIDPKDKSDYVSKFETALTGKAAVIPGYSIPSKLIEVPEKLKFLNKPTTTKYCTELSFINCSGIVIGPGDIKVAHTTEEFIDEAELSMAVKVYFDILNAFCF